MKTLKIISGFIFVACLTLAGCEKDDVLNTNSNESFVKNKFINNKDGGVDLSTDEELLDFTNSLLEGTVPIEQEFINAVFNTEYALNVALSTPGTPKTATQLPYNMFFPNNFVKRLPRFRKKGD